jgi:hypothetical protein
MTAKDELEDHDPTETISPSLGPGHRRFSLRVATGILCFVLSLLFYYGAVLRVEFKRTDLLDLGHYPDAVEYFAQANSILKEGAPTIQIGYDRLPSRYPPGYPVLVIPWLKVLPQRDIILAPFRTNQTIGLLLLAGSFVLYFAIGRPLAGGLAALLVATQPAFITFSRSSMSDLSGGAVTVLAFALVYLGLAWRRRWLIYCAAIVLGLSLCIRPQLLFMAPLLIAMALFPVTDSSTRWFIHCCLALLVFAVAASPYFILNTLEFGHPLKTGYDFWVPASYTQLPFSLHSVPRQVAMIWSEITASWDQFRVANLFGTGTYVVLAFIFLSTLGLAFVRVRRFEISAFLAGIVYFVATVTYTFVDMRFYMPIFFLLVALAVLPAEWAVGEALKMNFSISTVGVMAVFLLSCIGYPSQSGFKPKSGRLQAWDAFHYGNGKGKSLRYEAQKEFIRAFRDAAGIVLSDVEPPYLNALLPKPFVAAPIDANHDYCYSRLWHYGKAEAVQLVQNGLGQATPVYALLLPSKDVDQDVKRLPLIQGYSWKRSEKSDTRAVIMTLTKDAAAPTLDSASRSVEMLTE